MKTNISSRQRKFFGKGQAFASSLSRKKLAICLLLSLPGFLSSCSPVTTPAVNQYKLSAFSSKQFTGKPKRQTIMVGQPEAVAGYQTEQMLYITKPFRLTAFVNNAWIDPPAAMLFPLIVQSLQRSGYFYAVLSSVYAQPPDYRVDTQLIELQQNFLRKPSMIDLTVKVVLSRVHDNRVIASRLISQHVLAPIETPYGGVIAANRATENFTAELTNFIIRQIELRKKRLE